MITLWLVFAIPTATVNAQPNITPATPKPVFTKLAALFHIEPGEGRVLAALFALAGTIGFARVLV